MRQRRGSDFVSGENDGSASYEEKEYSKRPATKRDTAEIAVDEAPAWEENLIDDIERNTVSRLFHWGPLIAMSIVFFIGSVTTNFCVMWWPLDSIGGFCHLVFFFFWNYSTMVNMVRSSFTGAGFVPKNWTPKNIQSTCYDSLLQWCEPCGGYKAPRSHHCSKCSRCSLKMDHHCPWINNCVGHRNHAFFFRFLISAICGCVHALVIQISCFYHAIHLGFYLHFGSGSEPLIYVTFWSFIALVAASAFSVGVTIGLSGLLYLQVKYIRNNKTGIEEYIDQKAISCRDDDDVKWIYPYDLGWKRNVREVLGSWSGKTAGNGVWWPVVKGCDQFTLTREQLYQKELKKNHARLVHIERDFNGGFLGSLRMGCRVFICQPLSDEPRIKVNCGEHWVITRGQNHWFYGYCKGEEKRKGWFPRVCAVLLETSPYETKSSQSKDHND